MEKCEGFRDRDFQQSDLLMDPCCGREGRYWDHNKIQLFFCLFLFFLSLLYVCECPFNITALDKSVNSAVGEKLLNSWFNLFAF